LERPVLTEHRHDRRCVASFDRIEECVENGNWLYRLAQGIDVTGG
jgi:hypothetical protein